MSVVDLLSDVPLEVVRPVAVLIHGIIRVVRAGEDRAARETALMQTAEDLKRQLDDVKFGPRV